MKYFFNLLFSVSLLTGFFITLSTGSHAKAKFHIIVSTKYHDEHCTEDGGWCFNAGVWGDKVMQPSGSDSHIQDGKQALLQVDDYGRTMTLSFIDDANPYRLNTFDVQTDFEIPKEISRAMGYQTIVIQKGQYEVDFGKNPNGLISFIITTR